MSDERIQFVLSLATGETEALGICRNEAATLHLTSAMAAQHDVVQRHTEIQDLKRTAVFPEEL